MFRIDQYKALTVTFTFVFEHDNGTVEEPISYRPVEVDKQVKVEADGETTRVVTGEGEPPEGWERRGETVWEWLDRVTTGLPFTDGQGKPMTATQIHEQHPEYLSLLQEVLAQVRQHANPLSRSLMEMRRRS